MGVATFMTMSTLTRQCQLDVRVRIGLGCVRCGERHTCACRLMEVVDAKVVTVHGCSVVRVGGYDDDSTGW